MDTQKDMITKCFETTQSIHAKWKSGSKKLTLTQCLMNDCLDWWNVKDYTLHGDEEWELDECVSEGDSIKDESDNAEQRPGRETLI